MENEVPKLKQCVHCGVTPRVERAESGVIWIALICHAPNCFWTTWMMNSEQVILERGFAAWNTRATTIPSPPTAEQAEMTRRAAEKVYEYFWELRQHAVTIDRIKAIIASEL